MNKIKLKGYSKEPSQWDGSLEYQKGVDGYCRKYSQTPKILYLIYYNLDLYDFSILAMKLIYPHCILSETNYILIY